jgi:hypothetical protein
VGDARKHVLDCKRCVHRASATDHEHFWTLLDPGCPPATIDTRVRKLGSAPAENVVVRYFAGDPAQGGACCTSRSWQRQLRQVPRRRSR